MNYIQVPDGTDKKVKEFIELASKKFDWINFDDIEINYDVKNGLFYTFKKKPENNNASLFRIFWNEFFSKVN